MPTLHRRGVIAIVSFLAAVGLTAQARPPQVRESEPSRLLGALDMNPAPLSTDASVKYDYDIVYVRAPRSETKQPRFAEVGDPRNMDPGADLMLLHPDGSEEVLVDASGNESIADPQVSFDGQWVYYAKMHDTVRQNGADLFKIHVPTRRIQQLTSQEFTPNTGAARPSEVARPGWGVFNLGPCPLPGGRLAFVSDRNGFEAQNPGYAPNALALQLCVMDDDGGNVECLGHMNLGMALHPVVLKDGRIMFSTMESQGLRSHHLWGVWSIHPDGTYWEPLVSAFEIANGTADSFHFQTQLSDGRIVVESYYNLNNFGFGTYYMFPARPPDGVPAFGPAYKHDPRNALLRHGRTNDGRPIYYGFPFSPYGVEALTPFVVKEDNPSLPAVLGQPDSPRLGKFTHPSGAPDNHMLTVWSAGQVKGAKAPDFDSGIYLIKSGQPVEEPGQMRLVKNDPNFHEQWPRALVPYRRIHGVDAPAAIPSLANDGSESAYLPEGTPFGLVGTSSLYKRESYPYGAVKPGSVTATYAEDKDPTGYRGFDSSFNWSVQGSDAGLYENSDIHAIRIVHLEPTTRLNGPRAYYNHAREKMMILGEVPVRKFNGDTQPVDPDGNPDTSFLVKIPADVAWTFQTLDKRGMVLNSAQTWHQVRPGEVRNDCGGCHAHSQKPTDFQRTAAARADYKVFDLTTRPPLMTSRAHDETRQKWDTNNQTGIRFADGPVTVEYYRDIKPIFARSCNACHTEKAGRIPDGNLVLDDDTPVKATQPAGLGFTITVPGSYARLAADQEGTWGFKSLRRHGWQWTPQAASRYIRMLQSRRSLLIWKVFGERLDGWQNDDMPYEAIPGDPTSLHYKGQPVPDTPWYRERSHIGYTGEIMPPPAAVKAGTVAALGDEDRLTLVRWVDLGCPIDLTYDPKNPDNRGTGWFLDDQRPTLALTYPRAGANKSLDRILIGIHDLGTGLDMKSLEVIANVSIDGVSSGKNAAGKFREISPGVWEWRMTRPVDRLPKATLTVSIADRQGNVTRITRAFGVGSSEMSARR